MVFANPLYLLLLLLIIPVIAWYILKQKRMQAALQVSTTQPFDKMPRTYKIYLRHFNFVLRVLAVVLLIISGSYFHRSGQFVLLVLSCFRGFPAGQS